MINLWILADTIMCLVTMPCLVLNYYLDKNFNEKQKLELLINVQSNSLKNFYKDDPLASAEDRVQERKLLNKLTTRIYDKQQKNDSVVKT